MIIDPRDPAFFNDPAINHDINMEVNNAFSRVITSSLRFRASIRSRFKDPRTGRYVVFKDGGGLPTDAAGFIPINAFCDWLNKDRYHPTPRDKIINVALFSEKCRNTMVAKVCRITGRIIDIVAIGITQGFGIDKWLLRTHPHLRVEGAPNWFDPSRVGTRIRKECFTLDDEDAPAISAMIHKPRLRR